MIRLHIICTQVRKNESNSVVFNNVENGSVALNLIHIYEFFELVIHCNRSPSLYRGYYMSAYVLLNLLSKLGKRDKIRGLPSI